MPREISRQQVGRLSALEHLLLTWLAVLRARVLEALRRHSLLERGQQASFSLQAVVMEYLTDVLGERLAEEIALGNGQQLRRLALEQAQAKDYVRQTQIRLLVHPLVERLRSDLGADALVEAHLLRLLEQFRSEDAAVCIASPKSSSVGPHSLFLSGFRRRCPVTISLSMTPG